MVIKGKIIVMDFQTAEREEWRLMEDSRGR